MDHEQLHRRAREQGANRLLYWLVRALFQPVFYTYFRYVRIGREHIPARGPVIIASNHRSFLDPFVIATMARRPMYYVAKTELFRHRVVAWLLGALGAVPVQRGAGDEQFIETAKAILARGEIMLIFPEGTRTRPGTLGQPRRGVGRLALETGVPVVPVAIIGTEAVRRGVRIRPHKVMLRAGRPLRFPQVENPTPALAGLVTDRIWPSVMLQWEWLGGLPPIRRAAIVGAGAWGTSLAVCLARAGFEVELGCRTHEQAAELIDARENVRHLPGVAIPDAVRVLRAADLALAGHDLICLAVPARSLPSVMAALGERITSRHGVLVESTGLVAPLGTLPAAFAAERCKARAIAVLGGPVRAHDVLEQGVAVTLASLDLGLARQLGDTLAAVGFDVSISDDVTGVELARCAADAAVLAAGAASSAGPGMAGAAAGKVFAEVDALARSRGGRPETFAGLAGVGALVSSVLSDRSAHRRAGELLAQGMPAAELARAVGERADAVDYLPMLAGAARDARLQSPALDGLAALVQGQIQPQQWAATVTEPIVRRRSRPIRAA